MPSCWLIAKCGRESGGVRTNTLGVCPEAGSNRERCLIEELIERGVLIRDVPPNELFNRPSNRMPQVSPHGHGVLLVDDQPLIIRVLAQQLATELIPTDIATTPAEALERLRAKRYSVVVSDYDMPGMNGIELQEQIQLMHPSLPVIILSATANELSVPYQFSKMKLRDGEIIRLIRRLLRTTRSG